MKRWAGDKAAKLYFEVLDANELLYPNCFDVVREWERDVDNGERKRDAEREV